MIPEKRKLELTVDCPDSPDIQVSFAFLEKTLHAMQLALYHAADYVAGNPAGKRARFPKEVLQQCELFVTKLSLNSPLHLEAALPEPDLTLLPDQELGVLALITTKKALAAITSDDHVGLSRVIADQGYRGRFLRALEPAIPDETMPYEIKIGANGASNYVVLRPRTRQTVSHFLNPQESRAEDRFIVGTLVTLSISRGRRLALKLDDGRIIDCHFAADQEDFTQQVVGSLVEVSGQASLNENGVIVSLDEVYDVTPVELGPVRFRTITTGSKKYVLKKPISVEFNYLESQWSYEYPPLGIIACATKRGEALAQFHEEFDFLWNEYAQESDDKLTPDAQDIKRRMSDLVEKVEEVGHE